MNYLKILLLILLSSFFSDIPLAKESAQFGIVQKKSKLLESPKAISKRLPIRLNKGDTVKVLAGKNKKYLLLG